MLYGVCNVVGSYVSGKLCERHGALMMFLSVAFVMSPAYIALALKEFTPSDKQLTLLTVCASKDDYFYMEFNDVLQRLSSSFQSLAS